MNKPPCYNVNFRHDDTYFADLQKQFGSCFDKLTKREQLFLLSSLAARLCSYEEGEIRPSLITATRHAQGQLTRDESEGLCEVLINQIRGCHEQIHNS